MSNNQNDDLFARYPKSKIAKYKRWMKRNPLVYKMFVKYANQYRDAGYDQCSASLIGGRIRWECAIKTVGNPYKICNDWLPMMARQLALENATFGTFFSFRAANGLTAQDANDLGEGQGGVN